MKSWFYLHAERRCIQVDMEAPDGSERCTRKAHIGGLCGLHFAGAQVLVRRMAYLDEEIEKQIREDDAT